MDHIGINVHKSSSQICVLGESGERTERRIRTTRDELKKCFGERPAARILIEASTESEWVAVCLEGFGHEVIVADPNFAPMYATRSKKVKTDKRDARTLSEASKLGAYRPVHRPPPERRHERAELRVREALVFTRSKYISLIGALIRREGFRIAPGSARQVSGPPGAGRVTRDDGGRTRASHRRDAGNQRANRRGRAPPVGPREE